MLRNKKGEEGTGLMGKNLVEIIVAVIVVGILLGLLFSLLGGVFTKTKDTQAKEQIENIYDKIIVMSLGDEEQLNLYVPVDWHVVSFGVSENFVNNFEKPGIFVGKNAICICEKKQCKYCKETLLPVLSEENSVDFVMPIDIKVTKLEKSYKFEKIEQTQE